jgi:hypothetical protein
MMNGNIIAVCIDGWARRKARDFEGVIVFHITEDFELKSRTIAFQPVDGRQTGVNICRLLDYVLSFFCPNAFVTGVTSDSASNMEKCIVEGFSCEQWYSFQLIPVIIEETCN